MTVEIARSVDDIVPISFATDAREVALAVYGNLLSLLEQLESPDWQAPTECTEWDVADMVGHLIGAARSTTAAREMVRQHSWGWRHKRQFGGNPLDATNALQVREHADLHPAERIRRLRSLIEPAVAFRMRFPRLLRGLKVPIAPVGSTAGMPRSLSAGHLMGVIYTRDAWLHTVDIARATSRGLPLDSVDQRVVEDVVVEWARLHGEPFTLILTGAAGGAFRKGDDGPVIEIDAIEFCRIASGRAPGEGLLATAVLF